MPTSESSPIPCFAWTPCPKGPLSLNTKRFIVEMYERFTENACSNEGRPST